jgi:hypothetical protein
MNHAVCAAGMSHKESGTDQTQVTARVSTGECESLRVAACVLPCVTYVTCTRTLGSQALHSSRQKTVNCPLQFQLQPQLRVSGRVVNPNPAVTPAASQASTCSSTPPPPPSPPPPLPPTATSAPTALTRSAHALSCVSPMVTPSSFNQHNVTSCACSAIPAAAPSSPY